MLKETKRLVLTMINRTCENIVLLFLHEFFLEGKNNDYIVSMQ